MKSLIWNRCSVMVGLLAIVFTFLPFLFDFGRNVKFGGLNTYRAKEPGRKITGFWTLSDRLARVNRCFCEDETGGKSLQLGDVARLNPPEEQGYPYIWRDSSVCGLDGKVYSSAAEAKSKGVRPLHCGPHCGECSSEHDVKRYAEIGQDVAKVVGPCILSYLVGGPLVDNICMANRAKFTPACNDCWVDDHGCLVAHCYYDCVLKAKKHWERFLGINEPNKLTEDNDSCLVCMEEYCSAPFIRTCGVNRRAAGVRTDVDRQDRQICRHSIISSS